MFLKTEILLSLKYDASYKLLRNFDASYKLLRNFDASYKLLRNFDASYKLLRNFDASYKLLRNFKNMKFYELTYLISPSLSFEETKILTENIADSIRKEGGIVTEMKNPFRGKLAFPIKK